MWKNYSAGYFKNNRAMMTFIMVVALFASTLLSFVSHFYYNLWTDYVHRSYLKTGTETVEVSTALVIYTVIMVLIVISLVLMIYNTFAVSMNSRIHHLGVLKSVGATPKQLKSVLVQESLILCGIPVLLGNLSGLFMAYLVISIMIDAGELVRTYELDFVFSSWVLLLSIAISFFTIGISAWIPARKISRISVMDAIFNRESRMPRKMKKFRLLSALFGVEGELAGKSLYMRRKSLRIASAALFFAVMGFYIFMNTEKVSALSVQETYFNRFKDVWDYMITSEKSLEANLSVLEKIRETEGVGGCILYGKGNVYVSVAQESLGKKLIESGGPESLSGSVVQKEGESYLLELPVIVLDDDSFRDFAGNCDAQIGNTGNDNMDNVSGVEQGIILMNRIWDSLHSSRFEKEFLPFLEQGKSESLELSGAVGAEEKVMIKIAGYSNDGPALREEFASDRPVIVMSISYYEELGMTFLAGESFLTVKTDTMDDKGSFELENSLNLFPEGDKWESRIDVECSDERMRSGLRLIIGIVASVLACVGLSNVFSVALGQIQQRKREFARYLSIGLSPKGMKKILYLEALEISLKPILISLFLNIPFVIWILKQSGISLESYLKNMPFYLIFLFSFGIVFIVCLTYYIGGKKILSNDLVEVLKDERICG